MPLEQRETVLTISVCCCPLAIIICGIPPTDKLVDNVTLSVGKSKVATSMPCPRL